jgi:hypothetical protein
MRKEGTDVGWRLRADLHQDGDPSGLLFGRRPGCASGLAEPRPRATALCREHREVSRPQFNARPRGGPVVRSTSGRCDLVRVLVACGRGQPWVAGRVSSELAKRPAPRVPRDRYSRVVPEGRKCPAVARRTCSVIPRRGGITRDPVCLRGFVRRAAVSVASGTNGHEGRDPSDGVRLPTRSKPSKGKALVGTRTLPEPSLDGDDGLH